MVKVETIVVLRVVTMTDCRHTTFKKILQDLASRQGLDPFEFLHEVMQARLKDTQPVYKEPSEDDIEAMAEEWDQE